VTSRKLGGYGLHSQWNDDFHHALHSLQTGERFGYYRDFGSLRQVEKAMRQGYVYTGEYSEYRQRRHGNSSEAIRRSQLVVFSQNHDQIGNRMFGDRAAASLSLEAQKLSAGVVLLSPYLPLLFMGEEYGEVAPFQYFTSHSDPELAQAVREGRRDEFMAFFHEGDPPDPQAEATFERSRVDHELRKKGTQQALWNFYRELIRLRKEEPTFRELDASEMEVADCRAGNCLRVSRRLGGSEIFMLFNFGDHAANFAGEVPPGNWQKCLDSADIQWAGHGSEIPTTFSAETLSTLTLQPKSFCVLKRVHCV
jgi:maltooligosyltrehalose trehalohydrolase